MKKFPLIICLIGFQLAAWCQTPAVLNLRARAKVLDAIREDRLTNLLPQLMREQGVDMWLIITREYNEDPVFWSMRPSNWINARRRTILVFFDPGDGKPLERYYVQKHGMAGFEQAWQPRQDPPKWYEAEQWEALTDLIKDKNPRNISINVSPNFNHADGLATTDYRLLFEHLPKKYQDRLVEGGNLAVRWLETRTEQEIALYDHVCAIAHSIIAQAFSEEVITPGISTINDVRWWMREKVNSLNLGQWFFPSVMIQRPDPNGGEVLVFRNNDEVIQYGDWLWCDVGITYLRLNTDTQENAYVLKPGETHAPDYLKEAFATGNRLQDILLEHFETGKTGNDILLGTLEQMKQEGINGTIYTHPIGYHGHGCGPTIGLSEKQEFIPGSAEWKLYANTAYSIELNAKVEVQEWGGAVRVALEEEAMHTNSGAYFIDGRAKQLILIHHGESHLGK